MSYFWSLEQAQDIFNASIENHIPSAHAAGAQLIDYNEKELIISAPLALNHNDYGQAFGGSIFNLCCLAGWTSLYLACKKELGEQAIPKILTRDAQIRYRAPTDDEQLIFHCIQPNTRQWKGLFDRYKETGKTSITMVSKIAKPDHLEAQVDADVAARFDGVFVLLK